MNTPPEGLSTSTAINDRDHGALVKVTAGFCTALSLLALVARLQIRWPWRNLFGKDDVVAVVASAFAITQMVVVVYGVSEGFGKNAEDLSSATIESVGKIIYASDGLFVVVIFLAKLAVGLLYGRLSRDPTLSKAVAVLTTVPGVFGFLSVILVAIPTSGSSPWEAVEENAEGRIGCWIAVTAMSLLIEVALLIFPVWLVKGLQMKRGAKALIILAAWIRVPLIPVSILRLLSVRSILTSSVERANFTFAYASTENYTQIEQTLALVNATVLCLHNFLRFANSGVTDITVGTGGVVTTLYGGGSKGRSKGSYGVGGSGSNNHSSRLKGAFQESVKMATFSGNHSRGGGREQGNTASAVHADSVSMASDSSQRNIMVRHTVDVQYGTPQLSGEETGMGNKF